MVDNSDGRIQRRAKPPEGSSPLSNIEVCGLFGKYDFRPINVWGADAQAPNLAFLYGDNGVGKTTVLKLIYSILSPEPSGGHRTFIARTKFKRVTLKFLDGQWVSVCRSDLTAMSYQYEFGPQAAPSIKVSVDSSGHVVSGEKVNEQLIPRLRKLCPTLIFVNDQRVIRSTNDEWDIRRYLNSRISSGSVSVRGDQMVYSQALDVDTLSSMGLSHILGQASELLVSRAITGNARANIETGQVYLEVAKAMSRPRTARSAESGLSIDRFDRDIKRIKDEIPTLEKYGILNIPQLDDIISLVQKASGDNQSQLLNVLEPYISSIIKRIEESRSLKQMMFSFDDAVNGFLTRKRMEISLAEGIRFLDDSEEPLDSQALSSGERHLIYLFCVSLLSRGRPSLILVDEPELSMNYKWQRRVVESLLDASGAEAQFIMATHSFEILSRYKRAAADLEPLK